MNKVEEIINDINELEDIHLRCKTIFPKVDKSMIGRKSFRTAPYYISRGYDATISFTKPIDDDFIIEYQKVGNWINESAIIRLYSILHHHKVIGKCINLDQSISHWRDVDLCRWIRNCTTKTKLNYSPSERSRNMTLRKEIIEHYKLSPNEYEEGEIPTPADKVIKPMMYGCKEYVKKRFGENQ